MPALLFFQQTIKVFSSILLATDGQKHTLRAMETCSRIAEAFSASVTALHVLDPYLKQFYNDIYAQGRREYLEHVEECIRKGASSVEEETMAYFRGRGQDCRFITRYGDPEEEIVKEVQEGDYDLLILGGKVLTGLNRIRSWNLPTKIERRGLQVPILIVRSREQDPVPR